MNFNANNSIYPILPSLNISYNRPIDTTSHVKPQRENQSMFIVSPHPMRLETNNELGSLYFIM